MAIPAEFNQVEHLQSVVRNWINREIRDYFSDLGGEDWDPDLTTPRGSLRYACTHQDSDSLAITQMRWALFDRIRLQKFQMPMVGIPSGSHQESRRYRPQIQLYFQEDLSDIETGYAPVTGEVSFRLMSYDSDTITPTIAQTFANRIDTNFASGGGYVWRKGKVMVSYTDKRLGYQLQMLCRTEADGTALINQVLDIQNHTPDSSRTAATENLNPSAAYPTVPETERIYGETRRLPRKRPIADVRFQWALLHVWGMIHPIPLVDRTGLWPSALNAS